jgi:hypothetical protein
VHPNPIFQQANAFTGLSPSDFGISHRGVGRRGLRRRLAAEGATTSINAALRKRLEARQALP